MHKSRMQTSSTITAISPWSNSLCRNIIGSTNHIPMPSTTQTAFAITGLCFVFIVAVLLYCTLRRAHNTKNNSILNLQELGQLPRRPQPAHTRQTRRSHSTDIRQPRRSHSTHTQYPRRSHSAHTRRSRRRSSSPEERNK